jgi:ligand-binding sensor domain-containing protein
MKFFFRIVRCDNFLFVLSFLFITTNPLHAQWIKTSGDKISHIKCLFASGRNLFVGTEDSVFLSTDNGTSWIAASNGLPDWLPGVNVYDFAMSGTNLFAGTYYGVFLSTNNGTSWIEVNNGLPEMGRLASSDRLVSSIVVSPNGAGDTNLFVGTLHGIFLSTDNGTSWTAANNGLPESNRIVQSLVVSPNGAGGTNLFAGIWYGGVFLSTNNGTSWTSIGLESIAITELFFSGTNLFVGTADNGIILSTNNGLNWTGVNSGLPNFDVSVSAVSGTCLFAMTHPMWDGSAYVGGGVYLSTNNGTSWTAANSGLTNYNVSALAVSGSYLFAGTGDGVWRRALSEMTSVEKLSTGLPRQFNLSQNYPNPFNHSTIISFSILTRSFVSLKVFDLVGREVVTIVSEEKSSGSYLIQWNPNELPSGVYFYRLQADSFTETKKLILLK